MSLSPRPVEPRSGAGVPLTPFLLLGATWAAVAASWLAWAAGRLTALATGQPPGPAFGTQFVTDLLRGRWTELYPNLNRPLVAVVFAVVLSLASAPVLTGVAIWQRRRGHASDPLPSLARLRDVAHLAPAGVSQRARQLRPSLTNVPAKRLDPTQTGLALGTLRRPGRRGPTLRASWEDCIVALMGPRAMKTTALAVPLLLDAPGAALATSNRADLWATTHTARARTGEVWVFDPQAITRSGQRWWWNPLASIRTVEDATRMASHFLQPIRRGKGEDFWITAAEDLLTSFILAAAVSDGSMTDVQAWLAEVSDDEPVALLDQHGYSQASRSLRGRQHGAPETRDGIYETARTAAKCLQDPQIMAWVTPPARRDLPRFDPDRFPTSTDTLYLLSKDGAGSSGPLVAALTDQVLRYGVLRAEARGGRLDPPLVAVLDEAANICPIADLPQLYSHYGGRGICVLTILQNYQQGSVVWGHDGMGALWSTATVKLIGAGIDDARFAEDVSRLVGDHDVATLSLSRDATGYVSRQVSLRRQRILGPEDVRALERGTALLLASGARPALVRLLPWFDQPRATELTRATAASIAAISDDAERERLARQPREEPLAGRTLVDANPAGGSDGGNAAAFATVPRFRGRTRDR